MKCLKSLLILITFLTFTSYRISDEGLRIVFVGDSITDGGWGRGNGIKLPNSQRNHTDLNHIYGHSYMMLCAARLLADNPNKGLCFYNRGISGNTLADLEERWNDDVLKVNPDIISILIGTNDIHLFLMDESKEEFDFEGWEERYRNLLDQALEVNMKTNFILGTPFTAPTGNIGQNKNYERRKSLLKQMNEVIEDIANDYNALLIRYDKLFESLYEEYPDVGPEYWIWDGIHPTPAGHQAMADIWLKEYHILQRHGE